MTGFANRVRELHEGFNRRDFEQAASLVFGDSVPYINHGNGRTFTGAKEFMGWLNGTLTMSSDIRIVEARYVEVDDLVVAQFSSTGTQDGPFAFFPPSNKTFRVDVCEVYHLGADGNAVEAHQYSDGLGTLLQLGHIAPPDGF